MLSVLKARPLLSKEGVVDILIQLFDDSEECVGFNVARILKYVGRFLCEGFSKS